VALSNYFRRNKQAEKWEPVPWKEAKGYWEELLEGKYEWSSMGKLLRKKCLVK